MATHFECPTRRYTNQINSHHYRKKKEKKKEEDEKKEQSVHRYA